jgi:hypothetical protein
MLIASISSRVGTAAGVPDDFGCALPDRACPEPVAVDGMVTAAPVVAVDRCERVVGTAVCRALVERSVQVRAVVRRADGAPAMDGVTEHVGLTSSTAWRNWPSIS